MDVAIIPDGGSCQIQKVLLKCDVRTTGELFQIQVWASGSVSIISAEEWYLHDAAVETGEKSPLCLFSKRWDALV